MKKSLFSLFILIIFESCKQDYSIITLFEDEIWTNGKYLLVESNGIDLNNDSKIDSINIYHLDEWNDPGDFHKISVLYSSGNKLDIYNTGDWVNLDSIQLQEFQSKNILTSKRILVTTTADRTLLVVFGYSYASTPGKLTIIELSPKNPKILFQDNFELMSLNDLNNDNLIEAIGLRYYAEFYEGAIDSPILLQSYKPYHVFEIGTDSLILNVELSEEYNNKNYYGFFGLKFDSDSRYSIMMPNPWQEPDPSFEPYFEFEKYRRFPDASLRLLSEDELSKYSKDELRIMRNEIFAFHGYQFKSEDLKAYFTNQQWYKTSEQDINERLNKIEKTNISLIRELEKK